VSRAVLTALAPKGQSAAIMAAWAIAWAGSKPFASLIDGVLGSTIGVQWTGLILAFPALIPVVVILALPGVAAMLAKPGKAAARAEQTRQDWSITQNLWPLPSHKSFPVQPVSCS
jgi:ABC-type cobalamin transport system permease subunit